MIAKSKSMRLRCGLLSGHLFGCHSSMLVNKGTPWCQLVLGEEKQGQNKDAKENETKNETL